MTEPADDDAVEPITSGDTAYRCPECSDDAGLDVLVEPKGRMSPAAVVGLHRRQEHGVAGKPRAPRKRKGATTGGTVTPLRSVAAEVQTAIGRRKGAPTGDELTNGLAKLDGYLSVLMVGAIVDRDPRNISDADRGEIVEMLAPTARECQATWHPIGRRLAKTEVNRRFGRDFVDNLDLADSIVAIVSRYRRLGAYMSGRQTPDVLDVGQAAGVVPEGAGPGTMRPVGDVAGVVVTPAMVDRIRAQRGEAPVMAGPPQSEDYVE